MKRAIITLLAFSLCVWGVIFHLTACGGGDGGGGMDPYVVQELDLEAPNWIRFSDLAWDGANFWAHSTMGSVIYAFDTSGSQVDSFKSPFWGTFYSIRGMEYGDGSLWTLAVHSQTNDFMVFEMTTAGAIASSFILPAFYRDGLAYANTMVWIPGNEVFGMFSPSDGSFVGTIPGYTGTGYVDLFTEGGGNFWVVNSTYDPSESKGMHKFDHSGVELDFYPMEEWGSGITWANGYIWISRAPARIDAYDFQ